MEVGITGGAIGTLLFGGLGAIVAGVGSAFGCDAAIEHFGQFYEIVGELPDIVRYGTDAVAGIVGVSVGGTLGGYAGGLTGMTLGGAVGYALKDKSTKQ